MATRVWTYRSLAIIDGRSSRTYLGHLVDSGVEAVQVRNKLVPDAQLYRLVLETRQYLPAEIQVLVNGRWDIAVAAGADGIHLPSTGLAAGRIRRHLETLGAQIDKHRRSRGAPWWIGCSAHTLEEVERAIDAGADYATFGPVYSTPSKMALGLPLGLAPVRHASSLSLPLLALGGVDAGRVRACARAGATGVAAIRAFADADASRQMMSAIQEAWKLEGTT